MMGPTIREIAEAAGVSRGTVDRALNQRPGIKKEVAERIRAIAEAMGYQPNLAARMLAEHQYTRYTIGILLVTEENPFFDEVLSGIQAALLEFEQFGISNVLHVMKTYEISQQIQIMEEMAAAGVNGIVMTPIQCTEVAEKIHELNSKGIRVITINSDILHTDRMAYVGCRHKKSGVVLAGLLGLLAGGKNLHVGVITGSTKNLAVTRRTAGFMETLKRDFPNIMLKEVLENEDNDEVSYQITVEMMQKHEELDAVCVMGAGIPGVIRAVRDMGNDGKIKILVYDLIDEVKQALKTGTVTASITQEPYKQGYLGVQLMGKYLAYGQIPPAEFYYTDISIVTKYCLEE